MLFDLSPRKDTGTFTPGVIHLQLRSPAGLPSPDEAEKHAPLGPEKGVLRCLRSRRGPAAVEQPTALQGMGDNLDDGWIEEDVAATSAEVEEQAKELGVKVSAIEAESEDEGDDSEVGAGSGPFESTASNKGHATGKAEKKRKRIEALKARRKRFREGKGESSRPENARNGSEEPSAAGSGVDPRRPLVGLAGMSCEQQRRAFAAWFRGKCRERRETELEGGEAAADRLAELVQDGSGLPNRQPESLPGFVKALAADWRSYKDLKKGRIGSPRVLLLSCSARRCVKFVPGLRDAFAGQQVLKLFAKHLKVKDQKDALRKRKWISAVGTPGRALTLVQEGALSLAGTKLLVVDAQPDNKSFTLLETAGGELFDFLRAAAIEDGEVLSTLKLAFF